MSKPFTNAELARMSARLNRNLSSAVSDLAYGMWNPNFCSADCSSAALSLRIELTDFIQDIDRRLKAANSELRKRKA